MPMTSSRATDTTADSPAAGGSAWVGPAPLAERLRQAGLRVTAQRLAVLQAVAAHPHSTADEVLGLVVAGVDGVPGSGTSVARQGISRQAVYDVLTAGVSAGLLRRIEPAGSPARYETRAGDNHHHLICRACGHTADVDCAVGEAPCLHPLPLPPGPQAPRLSGFRIDEAEIVFWGWCADCDRDRSTADPSP